MGCEDSGYEPSGYHGQLTSGGHLGDRYERVLLLHKRNRMEWKLTLGLAAFVLILMFAPLSWHERVMQRVLRVLTIPPADDDTQREQDLQVRTGWAVGIIVSVIVVAIILLLNLLLSPY